ncbi:MAG: hypothetical protein R3D84_12205 [Paracoccaceae bacterium]
MLIRSEFLFLALLAAAIPLVSVYFAYGDAGLGALSVIERKQLAFNMIWSSLPMLLGAAVAKGARTIRVAVICLLASAAGWAYASLGSGLASAAQGQMAFFGPKQNWFLMLLPPALSVLIALSAFGSEQGD